MIERILYNGAFYTPHAQGVTALAIAGGRILAMGNDDAIRRLAGAATVQENLGGRRVMAGLTDAHLHLEWVARAMKSVDLFEVPSLAEAQARIAAFLSQVPVGEWLTGRGWVQALWEGGAFPTAQDLDTVVSDRPAYFAAKSGHAAWVNSLALRVCGINAHTPDPEGGQIVRDAQGNPTGILLETAMALVAKQIPSPAPDTLAAYIRDWQAQAVRVGLTGLHDFDDPTSLYATQLLRERGELTMRVLKQVNLAWLEPMIASGLRSGFGDTWLRMGALKMFADGALGPRTAYMVEPYVGEPENYGMVVVDKEEMHEAALRASRHGIATSIHAIGDRAVRDVLDVFAAVRADEAARGVAPHQLRHRIEHVQLIHPDDRNRLHDLQVIASMQPVHATSDYEVAARYWGEDRCEWAYNIRHQLDLGVACAFGSDAPVEPFNPFLGLYAAVTRQRADGMPAGGWKPHLRLTLPEAIAGFTTGAAYAAKQEHELGKLAEGYAADLIVLDRDIFALPPEALLEVQVVGTMVNGAWVYGGA